MGVVKERKSKAISGAIMKKKKVYIKQPKPNKIGFRSTVSIYKEKFSNQEITFRTKFSITKNITFSNHQKIANNLAKSFNKLKMLKY